MLFKEMERGRRSMIDDDSLNYSGSRKRTGERWTDGADGRERDQGLRERERESILATGNRSRGGRSGSQDGSLAHHITVRSR